jgi:hypothetical protein
MSTDPAPLAEPDPWRLDVWNSLADVCLISGCASYEIDQRGPIVLRDGSWWKACVEHWEAILGIVGRQRTWESTDGARHYSEPMEA